MATDWPHRGHTSKDRAMPYSGLADHNQESRRDVKNVRMTGIVVWVLNLKWRRNTILISIQS